MTAYSTEAWSDFFVAGAGASGALAGLVFVGVSINLSRILELPGVPARAARALIALAEALAITLICLAPDPDRVVLGAVLLVIGAGTWLWTTASQIRAPAAQTSRRNHLIQFLLTQTATLPFVVGAISLLAETGGGLYWVQAGVVLALTAGLANGWVLLVEILR
jgi:hypothetical protein